MITLLQEVAHVWDKFRPHWVLSSLDCKDVIDSNLDYALLKDTNAATNSNLFIIKGIHSFLPCIPHSQCNLTQFKEKLVDSLLSMAGNRQHLQFDPECVKMK